jgi:lysophospholipase L1-like esterase
VLLNDGRHLSIEGHRRVAAMILPTIARLVRDVAAARPA